MSSEDSGRSRLPSSTTGTGTSTATAAFADALSLVTSQRPSPAEAARAPAFRYQPPSPAGAGATMTRATVGGGLIAAARARIMNGEMTATALVEQAIEAAETQGKALGAVVELLADQARQEAARLDRVSEGGGSGTLGALHGIPITVKDIVHVAGVPTRAGSAAYYSVPDHDAVAVARARAAGAIVVAKVATHEFALGVTTPQSANPFDHRRIPGGSSGGSAIAVACGIGMASIGTDTRASIRVPAALCGVVGLKGTFGLVPTEGIVPLSWTMDHVAPMAATVADAALLLEVMAGRPLGWHIPPALGWRIGLCRAGFEGCEPSIARVCIAAIETLVEGSSAADGSFLDGSFGDRSSGSASSAGGDGSTVPGMERRRLVELDTPDALALDLANAAGLIISRCEAAAFHRSLDADRSAYWDEVSDQLDAADGVGAADYLDAQRLRAVLVAELMALFQYCDVLCLPTVGVAPPMRDDFTRFLTLLSRSCVPWSLAGFPAVSVPCGFDSAGFPVGLQIVGPPGADSIVIAAAAAIERARPAHPAL